MTPPDEPPSNPYDPSWPKPDQPYGQPPVEPPAGQPGDTAPYAPYGQQQPYGQAPYGQQPSYGAMLAPKHPSASTAMILGIVALAGTFLCGLPILLSPVAWVMGGRAVKEIDRSAGQLSGREQAQAGRIMGIIGTVLLGFMLLALFLLFAVGLSTGFSDTGNTYNDSYGDSGTSL